MALFALGTRKFMATGGLSCAPRYLDEHTSCLRPGDCQEEPFPLVVTTPMSPDAVTCPLEVKTAPQ